MARFITVSVGCDWDACEITAEENSGEVLAKTVSIDGKQAREFLLCKVHLDEFEAVVLPLMSAGIKTTVAEKTVDNTKSIECKACDRSLKNRAGLAQHIARTHGFADLAAYTAAYPD